MRSSKLALVLASIVACSAITARAEVKVVTDCNAGDKASADFKFTKVASPAKADAAAKTTIKMVAGENADGCRDATDLTQAKLPTEEDAPSDNFFFSDGSEGGRLQIDLGSVQPVEQVDTYSWHPNTRGPQIYKLYGADATAANFDASPKAGVDPTTCGWKLIASVDTREKGKEAGGQYAACISDTDGTLGKFRYLLMDCSRTESDDDFGNTFYSRVDVYTADKPAPKVDAAKMDSK